jgi:hypothetical protein
MAYGVILKHLEVDIKITWGSFSKKSFLRGVPPPLKRGADGLFGRKKGQGTLF